jgi:(E)-4-hydroxy-3-methylbut-2-enyl-diphosphate synthase
MDTVVADIEQRLEAYTEPIEVAVLGCAVNGIGEASHADFGITGAKDEGLIFAHGKPLRKVKQAELVDALFAEIDRSLDRGKVHVDEAESRKGADWLAKIEEENAGELTPERIAQMEKAETPTESERVLGDEGPELEQGEPYLKPVKVKRPELDEDASPTSGRRFTRA